MIIIKFIYSNTFSQQTTYWSLTMHLIFLKNKYKLDTKYNIIYSDNKILENLKFGKNIERYFIKNNKNRQRKS